MIGQMHVAATISDTAPGIDNVHHLVRVHQCPRLWYKRENMHMVGLLDIALLKASGLS